LSGVVSENKKEASSSPGRYEKHSDILFMFLLVLSMQWQQFLSEISNAPQQFFFSERLIFDADVCHVQCGVIKVYLTLLLQKYFEP